MPAEKHAACRPCRRRTELSSKVKISTSAPDLQRLEEGHPLLNRANIKLPTVLPGDICVLRIAEKKRQVYMFQRQINVTTNLGPLLKESVTPSFHFLFTARGLAQGWGKILVFPSSPFTTPRRSVMLVRVLAHSHGSPLPAWRLDSRSWAPPRPTELPVLSALGSWGATPVSQLQGCFLKCYSGIPCPDQHEAKPITICHNCDKSKFASLVARPGKPGMKHN